jgi:hypothetical protein
MEGRKNTNKKGTRKSRRRNVRTGGAKREKECEKKEEEGGKRSGKGKIMRKMNKGRTGEG